MSLWHEHAHADAHHAELRRQLERHHRAAACGRGRTGRRSASTWRLQQRLGVLLLETGLYLITRTGNRERLSLSHSAASSNPSPPLSHR